MKKIVILLFLFNVAHSILSNNAEILKCKCEWNEIETTDGTCVYSNQSYIDIWDSKNAKSFFVELKDVPSVRVQPLNCSENFTKERFPERAFISPEGYLILQEPHRIKEYCLEDTINEDGIRGSYYEMCIYDVPFNFCCKPNETLDIETRTLCVPSFEIDLTDYYNQYTHKINNPYCEQKVPLIMGIDPSDLSQMKNFQSSYLPQEVCFTAAYINEQLVFVVKACPCNKVTCVEYCCAEETAYSTEIGECVNTNQTFSTNKLNIPDEYNVHKIHNTITCLGRTIIDFNDASYNILKDGSLLPENGIKLQLHQYCLGLIIENNVTKPGGMSCIVEHPEPPCEWRFTLIQIMLCISTIFVITTIIIYLGVKVLRNKIGGICLISELIALLISQVNLVLIQKYQESYSRAGCLAAGIIEIIFLLASFFWLNVMCFDVWNTFRVLRAYNENMLRKKLLIKYSIYAWGTPLIIGMIALIAELKEASIRPQFEPFKGCFFTVENLHGQWLYLYGYMAILLVVNGIFFSHLTFKILPEQLEQRKKLLNKMSVKGPNEENAVDTENAKLYGKLFVIMGLPWLIEVLSSFAPLHYSCYLWVLDTLNLTRGILIFIIFVCLKSTRKKILAAWCPKKASDILSTSDPSRKTSAMSLSSFTSRKKSTASYRTQKYSVDEESSKHE